MSILTPFHFDGQNADEEVLFVIHRHWLNILISFLPVILMTLFLFFGSAYLPAVFPGMNDGEIGKIFSLGKNVFAMIIWALVFLIWIDYYFDVWIITTKRIVDIQQKGLFSRRVSEARYNKIQDVSTEVSGILQTFLNYGNVLVQTAAEKEKFAFMQVPDPYGIKNILMKMQKEHGHQLGEENDGSQHA